MKNHPKNNFDFVRLVAAFCVLISHQFALSGVPEPSVLGDQSLGRFGVLIFFSISGFLVAQSWIQDPNVARFAAKRLLRIWPGFAMVIVLAGVMLGPAISEKSFSDYFSDSLFRKYIKNLFFISSDRLPFQFTGNAHPEWINGALWTIPLELKCYAILCILGIMRVFRYRTALPVVTLLSSAAYFYFTPRDAYLALFGIFFLAGASLQSLQWHLSPGKYLPLIGLICSIALAALLFKQALLTLWLITPLAVVLLGTASFPALRQFGKFGDISYGVYLYAFPVQQTMIWLCHDKFSFGTVLFFSAATTIGCAFLSWHLIEKRALTLKPSRIHATG